MQDGEEIIHAEHETGVTSDPQPQADGAAGVGGIIATEPVAAEEPTPDNPGAGHEEPTVEEPVPEQAAEIPAQAAPFVDVPNLDIEPAGNADDPGDSQPIRFADSSVGVRITVDGAQSFSHVFRPNSNPLHDSLDSALKHSDGGIDLTSLAGESGYTLKINGEIVDPKRSSLDLGIADGTQIEVQLG